MILVLLFSSNLYAQSYTEQQDSLFQHLDKSKVTTGVLYDRAYPWASLKAEFPSDFSLSYDYVMQAWHELSLATYDTTELLSAEIVQKVIAFNEIKGIDITIGFIDYAINHISPTAFDDEILFYGADSLVYENEDDPYDTKVITLPLISTERLLGDSVTIYFDPQVMLSNTSRNVNHVDIHIDKNHNIRLLPGDLLTIDISNFTEGVVRFEVEADFDTNEGDLFRDLYMDNSWLYEFHFIPKPFEYDGNTCIKDSTIYSGVNRKFIGYDYPYSGWDQSLGGVQGFGEFRILYRQINNSWEKCADSIKKPVIIIDGFDPEDERKMLYSESGPGIWNMLEYSELPFGNKKHLGDQLRKLGYDVILLNFPDYIVGEYLAKFGLTEQDVINNPFLKPIFLRNGGADFIERNAMVLVRLIQYVNEKLVASGSEEELVIIGPSMGGQIARYALAYMEEQENLGVGNMNHNTRLYVSFDSPHLGANIPFSLQDVIYSLGTVFNKAKAREAYNNQLNSIAAQQMLIEQLNYGARNAPKFTEYYNNLTSNGLYNSEGWPMNLRKVALINGVDRGVKTGIEKDTILNLEAGLNGSLFKLLAFNQAKYNQTVPVLSWIYKIGGYISIRYNALNNNNHGSMDVVPGGTFYTAMTIKKMIEKELHNGYIPIYLSKAEVKSNQTFIPTVSALAFKDYDFDWSTDFSNQNLVCDGKIPFDNYMAATTNEQHVFISNAGANWVLNEILNENQIILKNITDSVPNNMSLICQFANRTIYHNYLITPCITVTWEADSNSGLQIAFSNDDFAEIYAIASSGNGIVRCTIDAGNGNSIIKEFQFEVGLDNPGIIDIIYFGGAVIGTATISNYDPVNYNYFWKLDNEPWTAANGPNFPGSVMQGNNTSNTLYLKTENSCGSFIDSVDVTLMTQSPVQIGAGIIDKIIVSPNPTNDFWNLSVLNSARKTIALYSVDGRKLYEIVTNDVELSIPADNLSSGAYFLKVQYGEKEKIIKLMKY